MVGSREMYRVGIIGGGPRGEWAAEELITRAYRDGVQLSIDVWEPFEVGSGQVYRAGMPETWLLNVPAQKVHTAEGPYDLSDEDFPPRVLVGEFLRRSWRALVQRAPAGTDLHHIQQRATAVSRAGALDTEPIALDTEPTALETGDGAAGEWTVTGADGSQKTYDEILIATGHATDWEGALEHRQAQVPVRTALLNPTVTDVPDGAAVGVRGAALTFIDLIQDWHAADTVIYPTNRGGRFMAVKPPEPVTPDKKYLERLRSAKDMGEFRAALADAATSLLSDVGAEVRANVEAVIDGTDFTGDPVAELRESLAVAEGTAPKTATWAVGMAWRELYSAIIDRASYGGKRTLEGFDALAGRMERIAFGPPPKTARRLVEAIDSGLVDPRYMGHAEVIDKWLAGDGVDLVIDAVIPPPGDKDVPEEETFTIVGRDIEGTLLGHDTLNRQVHDVIPRWADAVSARAAEAMRAADRAAGREASARGASARGIRGVVPLTARLEPWMKDLTFDTAHGLLEEYGSPVNVVNPEVLPRNAAELVDAGSRNGVDVRVHFARKANKALAFVDAARDAGHGIDVASLRELTQVLDRGVEPERIILSAAIKPDELLDRAVRAGVVISTDTVAELRRIADIARAAGVVALIAPRLAPDPGVLPPTRFGERLTVWRSALSSRIDGVDVVGVHLHLGGYAESDRRQGLAEALPLVDVLRDAGYSPEFIDIGGGVPMSYLDDANEWFNYRHQLELQNAGERAPFTWKSDPLANTYPFWQAPTRGGWLNLLLNSPVPGVANQRLVKDEFAERGLRLHLEPGRSLLDGGGVILARVAFVKERSDGLPLVGVEMNRTQCRTAADDLLLDPFLLRAEGGTAEAGAAAAGATQVGTTEVGGTAEPGAAQGGAADNAGLEAFLVGAYCIENEVIIRRRMVFPYGVAPGDIIAIPNTAGYFMHILESASHQIPLAKNVVWAEGGYLLADRINLNHP